MTRPTAESILSEFDPLSNSPSVPSLPTSTPRAPQSAERIFSRSTQPPARSDQRSFFDGIAAMGSTTAGGSTAGGITTESGITEGGAAVILLAERRKQALFDELERDPFSAVVDEPLRSQVTRYGGTEVGGQVPAMGGTAISIPHPRDRRSSIGRRTEGIAISPPRRLASLMDLLPSETIHDPLQPTKAMAIPQLSSPPLELFHPTSPTAQNTFDGFPQASTSNLSASPDWSDFQSAPISSSSGAFVGGSLTKVRPPRASTEGRRNTTTRSSPGRMTTVQKGWKTDWDYDAHGSGAIQPVVLAGVTPGLVKALEEDIAEAIRPNLPPRLRISTRWRLLYSVDQHGTSLKTMYECMEDVLGEVDGGCVLVVKDTQGRTFGAFINEGLREQKTYYGDGTCFLWKATPFPPSDFRVGHSVKSFKWTGQNEYYILTDSRSISVGGGDGRFGLWIDGVFEKGYSSRCPCFGNEPLVDWEKGRGVEEAQFEVLQFEVWAVGL